MPTISEKAKENLERANEWAKEIARQFQTVELDWITGTMTAACLLQKAMENTMREAYQESDAQFYDAAMFVDNILSSLKFYNKEVEIELLLEGGNT